MKDPSRVPPRACEGWGGGGPSSRAADDRPGPVDHHDGHLDLHSGRSQVSTESLAARVRDAGGAAELVEGVRSATTALDALQQCRAAGLPLGDLVAAGARETARGVLREAPVEVDVVVIDRAGTIVGRA